MNKYGNNNKKCILRHRACRDTEALVAAGACYQQLTKWVLRYYVPLHSLQDYSCTYNTPK